MPALLPSRRQPFDLSLRPLPPRRHSDPAPAGRKTPQFRCSIHAIASAPERLNQQTRHLPVARGYRMIRRLHGRVESYPHQSRAFVRKTVQVNFAAMAQHGSDGKNVVVLPYASGRRRRLSLARCRYSRNSKALRMSATTGRCRTIGRWRRPILSAPPGQSRRGAINPSTWRARASFPRSSMRWAGATFLLCSAETAR